MCQTWGWEVSSMSFYLILIKFRNCKPLTLGHTAGEQKRYRIVPMQICHSPTGISELHHTATHWLFSGSPYGIHKLIKYTICLVVQHYLRVMYIGYIPRDLWQSKLLGTSIASWLRWEYRTWETLGWQEGHIGEWLTGEHKQLNKAVFRSVTQKVRYVVPLSWESQMTLYK